MADQNQLEQEIQNSFQMATVQRKKLESNSSRFIIAGIILSALATFVAGVPSILGQTIIGDWRLTCAVAAVITLAATIVTSVQNHMANPDILTKASESVIRLRVLLLEMQSPECDYDRLRLYYQGILIDFSELEL